MAVAALAADRRCVGVAMLSQLWLTLIEDGTGRRDRYVTAFSHSSQYEV